MEVSVIIPIYKVETYIESCARSLLEQTLMDGIEYLFINDCSPDCSLSILSEVVKEYPQRESQIRIIDLKKNHGTAYVRTLGLKEATGEYIIFCDADDWVEPKMYEKMLLAAKREDVDIVTCNHIRHTNEGDFYTEHHYECTPTEMLLRLPEHEIYRFSALWNKLIRKSIFDLHDCYPFEGINQSEDLNVMIRVFFYARSICHLDEYFYHYNRLNVNSITTSIGNRRQLWKTQYDNINRISSFLAEKGHGKYSVTCNNLKFYTKNWFRGEMTEREFFYLWRESHRDILKYKTSPLKARIIQWLFYKSFWTYQLLNRITA